MSNKNLKFPTTAETAEFLNRRPQESYVGMCTGVPLTKIPEGYAYRNVNLIDRGNYKESRPGTRRLSATSFGTTEANAYCDQRKLDQLFYLRGSDIKRSNKQFAVFDDVFYLSTQSALSSTVSMMVPFESEVHLANSNALVRIVYDENNDAYYAYQMNIPVPTTIITDVEEDVSKIYVYRYIYGFGRIIKSGNNLGVVDRLANGASIVLESGTSKNPEAEKDYGEVAFDSAIDNVASDPHSIGTLTCPASNREATHYPLYRTKNIGEESDGINAETGIGNNSEYYVWVADVPIASAYVISAIDGGTRTLTTTAGSKEFVPGDVGNTLTDTAGNTGIIEEYVDANNVILVAGYTLAVGTPNVALGNGRVMSASQTGTTITRTAGGSFDASDVGRPFFWSDGGMSIIKSYTDANNVEALWSETHAAGAGTIADTANGFSRQYNDTTLDDGGGEARISLQDRIGSGKSIYIPPRFFSPIPNGNMVTSGYGFTVVQNRDDAKYYYSQIGDKRFWCGHYRDDIQFDETEGPTRMIIRKEGTVHIWNRNTTENLLLNVSQEVGNPEVGESITKLGAPYLADANIGCYHWQTIRDIEYGRFCLLTDEPTVRVYDGQKYQPRDFAISVNGVKMVQEYLFQIIPSYTVLASYSILGGYKLYITKWSRS
jgi:hypothetical protein